MKYYPLKPHVAIAVVLVCSNLTAYAEDESKPQQVVVKGHKEDLPISDWQPPQTIDIPWSSGIFSSTYTVSLAQNNSTLEPPTSCKPVPNTNPATPKPVVIATGEKFKLEQDFVAAKTNGLSLERTYRSKPSGGKLFGPNWITGFEYPDLVVSTDWVKVSDSTGAQYVLNKMPPPPGGFPGGIIVYSGAYGDLTWHPDQGVYYELLKDNQRYIYNSKGQLVSVGTKGGSSVIGFGYDPSDQSGKLIAVSGGGASMRGSPGRTAG
jgi:hypothetical protein